MNISTAMALWAFVRGVFFLQEVVCTLLLEKAHIGEVRIPVWDEDTTSGCKAAGIKLL